MREVNKLYVSSIKNIRNKEGICAVFAVFLWKAKDLGQSVWHFEGEMILNSTGLSQLLVAAKQDGRGYKTKMGACQKHSFFPDPDKRKCICIRRVIVCVAGNSTMRQVSRFFTFMNVQCQKECFKCQITRKTKQIWPQNDCQMNRQTKWTWASHDFVLIKYIQYCCEGNCHDTMFRCCGGALVSGNASIVHNGRSWCDGLGAFHIIAETIRN